jgi:hypothetical protein
VSLDAEIGDFGSLVGLLLALVTLLTANRSTALDRLRSSSMPRKEQAAFESALDGSLAVVTLLVLLAGLPLWIRAVSHLQPLAHGGSLRSVFVLAWLLLVPLVVWQANLARTAWRLRQRIPDDRRPGGVSPREERPRA